jgi:murein DD-endopeptidase MepM/ murein hydrolase activator NlpD
MMGDRKELIELVSSRRGFSVLLLVTASLFCILGSPVRPPSAPALGGMDLRLLDLPASQAPGTASGEDRGLFYSAYVVRPGDTLSAIAERYDISLDTIVSVNAVKNARSLQPGQILKVPSMSGVLYVAKAGDTVSKVAAENQVSEERLVEANGLMSAELRAGRILFLPDARLASFALREISGDLFRMPVRGGYFTSYFGYRSDPFSGARGFHNGLDIGVDSGTPVYAGMDGIVSETGYSTMSGNYVLLAHHSGWSSFYGHLKSVSVTGRQRVTAVTRIGYSGNTGYTTGPHLHFSVFKYGRALNPRNYLR